jgi:hypothetical protein
MHCPQESEALPIALISLPDSFHRRAVLLSRGIPPDWVNNYWSGTDYRKESAATLHACADIDLLETRYRRPVRPSEIGCAVAHRAVSDWLARSCHQMVLVLEDDVIAVTADFTREIEGIASTLAVHAHSDAAFICHLGPPAEQVRHAIRRRVAKPRIGAVATSPLLWLHTDPGRSLWRAHAYLLSRGAAIRAAQIETRIMTLSDDWLARRQLGLIDQIFFVDHVIFKQDETAASTIGPRTPFIPSHPEAPKSQPRSSDWHTARDQPLTIRAAAALRNRAMVQWARVASLIPYRIP